MMMIIILKTMLMVSDRDFGYDDFHLSVIPPPRSPDNRW